MGEACPSFRDDERVRPSEFQSADTRYPSKESRDYSPETAIIKRMVKETRKNVGFLL
jgi:hypothetical protein